MSQIVPINGTYYIFTFYQLLSSMKDNYRAPWRSLKEGQEESKKPLMENLTYWDYEAFNREVDELIK